MPEPDEPQLAEHLVHQLRDDIGDALSTRGVHLDAADLLYVVREITPIIVSVDKNAQARGYHDGVSDRQEAGPTPALDAVQQAREAALTAARDALLGRPGAFQGQRDPDCYNLIRTASWIVTGDDDIFVKPDSPMTEAAEDPQA